MVFFSCNNEDYNMESDNSDQPLKYVSAEELAKLLEGVSDTVYTIEDEKDFNRLLNEVSIQQEQELLSMGYEKIEESDFLMMTKAAPSVQKINVKISPNNCPQISDQFKASFSQKFCDQINGTGAVTPIRPGKTYLCNWRDAGTFFNLADNQRGGVAPSPKAALKPTTKGNFTTGNAERGYDAYKNAHNQYILASHMLKVVCEDTKGPTVNIGAQYPYWDSKTGVYEINYSILTLN